MRFRLKLLILLAEVAGLSATAVTWLIAGDEGVGSVAVLIGLTLLLAVDWTFPLFLISKDESESIHLDEAYLVIAVLLLPPFGTVSLFLAAAAAAGIARRRPPSRVVFNVGQLTASAAVGVGVAHLVAPGGAAVSAGDLGAAAAAAGVFSILNWVSVALAVSTADGAPFRRVWLDGLQTRLMLWVGAVSVGVMAGLAGSAHQWALLFAVAPIVVLRQVLTSHVRARRDRERMEGLFRAATEAHASIGIAEVERVVCDKAREFLRCTTARVGTEPPTPGELGVRLGTDASGGDRWLVVAHRRGAEPFDAADLHLLEAIAATTATAIDNAALYAEVAAERKKMTDVVTSSSDGILSVDVDQRIQSWNPAMARITGISAGDAIGAKCYMVFRPRDEAGNELCTSHCPGRCIDLDDGLNGEPVNVQITTLANELRWLTCTYSPLPDGGYVVVARDITTQKQVDDLKADFLATVSHELRTPLTPIQGFLHTLMREDVSFDDDHRRRFYDVMLRQSERLERLVNDLLDATSLQDSQQLFLPERLDWAASVAHTVELFRSQEPSREFVVELAPSLPHVVADEQRAEQILSNLVNNAIKYSPEGGPVRVTVEEIDGAVRTTVFDCGPGVPPGDRERIFERFTRLGDHLTRKVGGAGLGLFIAKRLVEAMGGEISVDAAPEGGAAFSFTLPPYAGARTIQL